jgi:uncharacterized protein
MITKDQILQILTESRSEWQIQFEVKSLGLFGSAARNELKETSDIDVLVTFQNATTFKRYLGLKRYLEHLLNKPVDLITESGLKPRARSYVEKDLIRVA